jgi:hypothetical protein
MPLAFFQLISYPYKILPSYIVPSYPLSLLHPSLRIPSLAYPLPKFKPPKTKSKKQCQKAHLTENSGIYEHIKRKRMHKVKNPGV